MKTATEVLLFSVCVLVLGVMTAQSQSAGDFRSHQKGNWNDVNSWERYNGTTWITPAPSTPTAADGAITVRSPDTLTVTVDTTVDQVSVNAGGVVSINTGVTLRISDAADSVDMSVSGTLINSGAVTPSGVLRFGSGAIYLHPQGGGNIPTATWGSGSTIQLTGITSGTPGNGNQNFYNVVWNCPNQTANLNLGWNNNTIGGNITVVNTGSGRWQLTAPAASATATVTIMGDVIQSAGNFTTNGTSNANTTIVINHYGNINVTGGNFAISRGSQGGTGTSTWNLFNGNISIAGATVQNSTTLAGGAKFVFKKPGTQTLTLSSVTFAGGGLPIQVDSGATLNMGTSIIRGSGIFTLNAGATLGCSHEAGLDSTLQNTGTRTLSADAGYTFNGSLAQVTGTLLPFSIKNLTLENASGVSLSSTTIVNGTLALTGGNLSTAANTLIISPSGTVVRTSGHVVGSLQKSVAPGASVARTFEIGSGTSYTPASLSFATVTTTGNLVASTTGTDHPSIATSGIDPSKSVNRYWTLTNNGVGFTTCNAVFNFVPADLDPGANPNTFIAAKYSGGTWSGLTVGTRTATSLQVLGVTSFSDFVIGQPPAATIQSNGTGGGDWTSGSTWQGGVVPAAVDSVIIRSSDSVFVVSNTLCGGLAVQSGGRLALGAKLSPSNVNLNGRIIVQADTLNPLGVMSVGSTGVYEQAQNGGRIPTATWGTGSTCLITGVTATAPGNGNQNFHHVSWNCPAQTANVNMGWNNITIGGNITIVNTGTGRWQMAAPVVGASATITLMGDVIQSAGNFSTNGTGNANTTIVINHSGNIVVTGGNFAISRGSQGGTGTSTWNLLNGNMSISNATTQNSTTTSGGASFVFARPGAQILALTNVTFGGGGLPVVVNSGSTLNTGTSVIRGSGAFTVNATATLACGHPGGLDSLLQNTGTRTLSAGAGYTFNGSTPQVTGTLLPSAITNLTVSNDSGVALLAGTTVNGTLSVVRGDLNLNGNTITLGPTAVLSETPGNTVAGATGVINATRTLNAPSDTVDIAGLGVKIGSAANLGGTVITRGHAVQSPAGGSIKRYFDITPTNNTGLNATLRFRYDQSELNGLGEQNLRLFRSTDNGSTWTQAGGTVDTAANIITLTGVNALSRWTAATVLAPSAPQLVSPANGATIGADSARCVWNRSTPAVTNYWFERALDSVFTSPLIDSTLTDTSKVTRPLVTNTTYWWRVRAKNAAGWGPYSSTRRFIAIFTGVDETEVPIEFSLTQNYPNPFNPTTSIKFSVEKSGRTQLELFNILGQKMMRLFDDVAEPGRYYTVKLDGSALASGVYIYRLQSGQKSALKKLVLVK